MAKTNARAQLLRILAELGTYRTSLRKRWDIHVSDWLPSGKYGVKPHAQLPESSADRWADVVTYLDDMAGLLAQARELAVREQLAHLNGTCEECDA